MLASSICSDVRFLLFPLLVFEHVDGGGDTRQLILLTLNTFARSYVTANRTGDTTNHTIHTTHYTRAESSRMPFYTRSVANIRIHYSSMCDRVPGQIRSHKLMFQLFAFPLALWSRTQLLTRKLCLTAPLRPETAEYPACSQLFAGKLLACQTAKNPGFSLMGMPNR